MAYADFVTAMMAFFLVMWLVGQSDEVKKGVGGYFRDPVAFGQGAGVLEGGGAPAGASVPDAKPSDPADRRDAEDAVRRSLEHAGEAIRAMLDAMPGFESLKDQVEIEMTPDGLRIEMVESGEKEIFFKSGSAELGKHTARLLYAIAGQLRALPNHIVIEGHTDSRTFAAGSRYTNWELSADRANAARSALETAGLPPGRIREIRGYAANEPRFPDRPEDPRNRRISILVLNDFGVAAGTPTARR